MTRLRFLLLVWFVAVALPVHGAGEKTKVLLLGHKLDHPWGTHMYLHECGVLAKCLRQTPGVEAIVSDGWPEDAGVLEGVDALVLYSSAGGDLLLGGPHREAFLKMIDQDVGYTAIHWATADRDMARGPEYLRILGGWYVYAFGGLDTTTSPLVQIRPDHPICRGWQPHEILDEFYCGTKILPVAEPILMVQAQGKDRTEPADQVVAWVLERPGSEGRSFGITLGHFHKNFESEAFRRMLVNGILWTAHRDVPAGGAPCRLSDQDLRLPPKPASHEK